MKVFQTYSGGPEVSNKINNNQLKYFKPCHKNQIIGQLFHSDEPNTYVKSHGSGLLYYYEALLSLLARTEGVAIGIVLRPQTATIQEQLKRGYYLRVATTREWHLTEQIQ